MPNESYSLICWEIKRDHYENVFGFNSSPHALHKSESFPSHRAVLWGCTRTLTKIPDLTGSQYGRLCTIAIAQQIIISTVTICTVCKKEAPACVGRWQHQESRPSRFWRAGSGQCKDPGQSSTREVSLNNLSINCQLINVKARKKLHWVKSYIFKTNENQNRQLQSVQFSCLCCTASFQLFFQDCFHRTKAFSETSALAELFENSAQVRQAGVAGDGQEVGCIAKKESVDPEDFPAYPASPTTPHPWPPLLPALFPCLPCPACPPCPTCLPCSACLCCLLVSHCRLWQDSFAPPEYLGQFFFLLPLT